MKYPLPTCLTTLTTAMLLLCTTGSQASTPNWVKANGVCPADFPPERFATGFGISGTDKSTPKHEKLSFATDAARGELALSLRAGICSESVINSFSAITGNHEQLVDEYKSKCVTRSNINLEGVKTKTYWQDKTAYALAYLDKPAALRHYTAKFKNQLQRLIETQNAGNLQIASGQVSAARDTFIKCEKIVDQIEETLVIQDLLDGPSLLSKDALKQIAGVKSTVGRLWRRQADSVSDCTQQMALKIARQIPRAGRVQINAPMLEDSYQYSEFSGYFRTATERAISQYTDLTPITAKQMDFTPAASTIARHGMIANNVDFLLTGTYFIKENDLHIYEKLIDAKSMDVVATADARLTLKAVKGMETKPRNYIQTLQDHKVFSKNELVGGKLSLEAWTTRGIDGLVLESGDELKIMVRVNRPSYLRFIYHLNNGARIIPGKLYMNYYIGADKVNKVVTLPDTFEVCPPFGSETIQLFCSNSQFPALQPAERKFDGEIYNVISESLEKSNILHRGLRLKNKQTEVREVRIPLTTIKKLKTES
jgi:hypothetical protein